MNQPVTLLALVAAAAAAPAQTTTTVILTNGNMEYRQVALPAVTSNTWCGADLRSAGGASLDALFSFWWYYRVAGDTQETTFRNDAAPNAPTRVLTPPVMTTTWPNVAGRNLFSAQLINVLVSTGTDRGYVTGAMSITNISGSPLTIDIFTLSDLDVGGSSVGYLTNVSWGNVRSQYTEQQGAAVHALEFYCPDADAVQVDDYLTTTPGRLPYLLTNTTVDNLSGWSGTYGPGDHNGAFQWHRTIAPNQTMTFTAYIAMTGHKPLQSLYGTAGAGTPGLPTIRTSERAIVDPTNAVPRSFDVQLGNARPLSAAFLLSNFTQASTTIAGLSVWVDPNGAFTRFALVDSSGNAALTFGVPPIGSLYGLTLDHQYFVLDSGGVGGLAAFTQGLFQQIGSW
jgi:hypothetical protein